MFEFIKQVFIILLSFSGSLASMASIFNFETCISLNNQPCMTRPTLIDLNSHEDNHVLCDYPFMVNLDGCNGNCNPSGRICVPNRRKDVNVNAYHIITRINKWKTLKKNI